MIEDDYDSGDGCNAAAWQAGFPVDEDGLRRLAFQHVAGGDLTCESVGSAVATTPCRFDLAGRLVLWRATVQASAPGGFLGLDALIAGPGLHGAGGGSGIGCVCYSGPGLVMRFGGLAVKVARFP